VSGPGRPLRVGIVAPLWAAVPPRSYGGIERHLHLLVEELTRRGHDVTLFATADSHTAGRLHPVCDEAVADMMDRGDAAFYEHYVNAGVAAAVRSAPDFDILHFHVGMAAVPLAALARAPVLHTMHNGITVDDVWVLNRHPDVAVTALSRRQIAAVPSSRRESIRVVPYGIDVDHCAVADAPQHLVFLGRMAPHKGPDEAVRIARAAGRPIVLAGAPVTASEHAWFEKEVEPLLEAPDVTWIGGIGETDKDALFRHAAALVLPIRWDEPFGLVMLEAIARGVPVLALRRGSVPEVIEPGLTGWYAESSEGLAAFVEAAERLDRGAVRERARQRFSVQRMADDYLAVYAAVGSEPAGVALPHGAAASGGGGTT
jgi:glycosyltransferase involved in cell wall biosynthesis